MKNITIIYIVLAFFTYIISCSVIYMIVNDMYNKRHKRKVQDLDNTFKKEILKQLEDIKNQKNITKINIEYVRNKIKKRRYKDSFHNALFEFNKDYNNHKYTRIYTKNFEDIIINEIKICKRKDDIIKSYYVMLLGEYKLSNIEIKDFLYNCLNTNSTQLRTLALKSISKIGNLNYLISSIRYISDNRKYVNNKMFIDIINIFCGNKSLLNKNLIKIFGELNYEVQKVIIEHFKNNKIDYVKLDLLNMLKSENTHKEVKISIIKYFAVVRYKEAKQIIIDIINSKDWEYRTVCASTLGNYNSKESIEILLKTITDKNWYVRYNSAMSLLGFDKDYIEERIIKQEDKYSRDILFYAMFVKDKISYEKYLEEIGDVVYSC
ncbi:HEAT repeat domain-containing protein [Romboutsia sp. 1001285H_161024_C4]|uniref:HEAT repeat domain-containing protein n=1 Tax=Romboutsia sp. 1001285H_161024_C4 TaxID=2787109 RepID=UPI0018982AA0|nr:HEAT repeat domain-containing protein [Romboutsia sp. 1001285H_161024_C4]